MNMTEKINAWIDEHAEEMIEELQGFARIPSVSRSDLAEENAPFGPDCRKMLDYALKRAAEMGFETDDHDGYIGSACMGDMNNAIGIIGHMDVVPVGKGWIYPPYEATRLGKDFLIGRGVSDNKSACVMSLFLMKMFRELGVEMKHGLRAILGISEETGMQDLSYFKEHAVVPVISLVPDSSFPVCRAQKGSLSARVSIEKGAQLDELFAGEAVNIVPPEASVIVKLPADAVKAALSAKEEGKYAVEEADGGCKLTAFGRPAHAAAPEGGLNAIHLLMEALCDLPLTDETSIAAVKAILKLTEGYYGECVNIAAEDEVSGKTTLNIGLARTAGDRFQLHLDSRLSIASFPSEMVAACTEAAEKLGFAMDEADTTQPFNLPDDHPAMNALMDAYREITGRDDPAYSMGGGTYSRIIPTAVTFGLGLPGGKVRPEGLPEGHGGAHQCDEYLYIPNWLEAVKIYASAVLKLDQVIA